MTGDKAQKWWTAALAGTVNFAMTGHSKLAYVWDEEADQFNFSLISFLNLLYIYTPAEIRVACECKEQFQIKKDAFFVC